VTASSATARSAIPKRGTWESRCNGLTAAMRRAKGIPESTEGALVNNVEDGSPATKAESGAGTSFWK